MERVGVRARPATAAVMLLCTVLFVVVFVWSSLRADEPGRAMLTSLWMLEDVEVLTRFGALVDARVWLDGEWWRVASTGLLHGSWLHLGFNMMALWVLGEWTEKIWGGWRSTGVLVVSSVVGCLASLAWAEAPLVVGISAGLFGLAGALVFARAWGRDSIREALEPLNLRSLVGSLVFWLVVGFALPRWFDFEVIAQAGHIGGLLAGLVLGAGLSRERKGFETLGWASTVVGGIALGFVAREPSWRANYHLFIGYEQLDRGEFEPAARAFEEALQREPDDPELFNAAAWAFVEAGVELERAEVLVREALAVEPERADFLDTLGWILCKQGRVAEGVGVLEQAVAADEDEAIPEILEHVEQCGEVGPAEVPRGT